MDRDARGRFLPGHTLPSPPPVPVPPALWSEAGRARHAAANTSAKGRKGKAKSPWSRGPMASTKSAGLSYLRTRKVLP